MSALQKMKLNKKVTVNHFKLDGQEKLEKLTFDQKSESCEGCEKGSRLRKQQVPSLRRRL